MSSSGAQRLPAAGTEKRRRPAPAESSLAVFAVWLCDARLMMNMVGEAMFVFISNMYLGEMVKKELKGSILCSLSVAC